MKLIPEQQPLGLKLLDKGDFEQLYGILLESFPPDELRSRQEHRELLDAPAYQVWACYEQQLQGFLTVWSLQEFAFIEHFAVRIDCRNGGLGSKLLQALSQKLGKRLCLEAELPETDMAKRRLDFYRRNGFSVNEYPYLQPALEEGKNPVPLHILTTGGPVSEEEFETLVTEIYKTVYKGKMSRRT